jgi:hypothetical protein
MKALAVLLLLIGAARAEHSDGGGGGAVSIASGEQIYAAVAARGGINGQLIVRRLSVDGGAYVLAAVAGRADFDAMVWKLAPLGDVLWSYRYSASDPVYAQNLYLDSRGDRLRAFVLRKRGTEFIEEFFRLDLAGHML